MGQKMERDLGILDQGRSYHVWVTSVKQAQNGFNQGEDLARLI